MFCSRCGADVNDEMAYCTSCGAPMDTSNAPSELDSAAPADDRWQTHSRVEKAKFALAIVFVVLLVVCVTLAVLLMLSKNKQSVPDSNSSVSTQSVASESEQVPEQTDNNEDATSQEGQTTDLVQREDPFQGAPPAETNSEGAEQQSTPPAETNSEGAEQQERATA